MKTKAAVLEAVTSQLPFEKSKPLNISEVEIAKPGYGEVMVKVMAAGLCQSDVSVMKGNLVRPLPMVIGHEAAGIVYEVGEGVTGLQPG
ncbi:alcohol dehydrogenase, partial [Butyricicoccus sp. 1XD8-22]